MMPSCKYSHCLKINALDDRKIKNRNRITISRFFASATLSITETYCALEYAYNYTTKTNTKITKFSSGTTRSKKLLRAQTPRFKKYKKNSKKSTT